MSNFVYNEFKRAVAAGEIDLDAPNDIRVILCMTNTTADTEDDVNTISGFTTLDEADGANYARIALASEAVNEDATNNRAEFDANDITWTALGAGTRQYQGMIVYKHVGADSSNIPICWVDTGGFPFTGNGSNVTVQWNAEGILQFA
jgi:hypothetical protein